MHPDSNFSVVIIGGGFCGVMTFVNLLEKLNRKASITIINKSYPLARGVAYKTYSDRHLLNVEARNMSAFHDQPDHFLDWCYLQKDININKEELPFSYLPRNIYGRYLDEILNAKFKEIPTSISLHVIEDEVTDIEGNIKNLIIKTSKGNQIHADKVVLATGNCEPSPPINADNPFLKSNNYFSNPWNEKAVQGLQENETVLIVGSGLTMVDVILGLKEKKFNGKIISLSPHGYQILPHRKLPPQRYILDELSPPYDLENLFRLFYKHIRDARKRGLPGETVVDAIRARTQEIWQHLSLKDKKKFMMHLRHLWGNARHRLPAYVHEDIRQMIDENKLEVIAGRIRSISETKNGIEIKIRKRKDQSEMLLNVARVINCTGPESDIKKQKSRLYDSLLKKGMIRTDDMNLGIDAVTTGQIIDANNNISNQIYAMGSLLRGKLWESTAIPELRTQAYHIAELINKDMEGVAGLGSLVEIPDIG